MEFSAPLQGELSRKLLAVYETEGLLLRLVVELFHNPSVIISKKFAVTLRKQDYTESDIYRGFKVLRNQTPSAFPDSINAVTTSLNM